MTIRLSEELERFVHEAVRAGRYATEDDVVNDALERLRRQTPLPTPGMGSIGAMRDDAELLDRVTHEVMKSREGRALRLAPDE
jgi:putative addiction module CopG family antidote